MTSIIVEDGFPAYRVDTVFAAMSHPMFAFLGNPSAHGAKPVWRMFLVRQERRYKHNPTQLLP
jgi:hypothetical protein